MASLALHNARAIRSGQFAWDAAEPPSDSESWLETTEGANWMHESIDSLIAGRAVDGITHEQLVDELDTEVIPNIDWNQNGRLLAILLADILKNDTHPLFSTANQFLGGTRDKKAQPLRDLAERMLTPKAAEYCRRMQEDCY